MKNLITRANLTIMLLLAGVYTFAQNGIDIDVDLNKEDWYENPYLIALAAALLIIVALIVRKK